MFKPMKDTFQHWGKNSKVKLYQQAMEARFKSPILGKTDMLFNVLFPKSPLEKKQKTQLRSVSAVYACLILVIYKCIHCFTSSSNQINIGGFGCWLK